MLKCFFDRYAQTQLENLASTRAAARDAGLDYRSGGVGNNASLFAQSMRQASEQSRDDAKKLDDLRSMLGEKKYY